MRKFFTDNFYLPIGIVLLLVIFVYCAFTINSDESQAQPIIRVRHFSILNTNYTQSKWQTFNYVEFSIDYSGGGINKFIKWEDENGNNFCMKVSEGIIYKNLPDY